MLIPEKSPEEIEKSISDDLKSKVSGLDLLPSDPLTKLIQVFAYREAMLVKRVNDAASQCMLAFAKGTNLDNLVGLLGVKRDELEEDADLREKALSALDKMSTAGSEAGYRYHCLKIGGKKILDCRPYQEMVKVEGGEFEEPEAGVVRLCILLEDEYYPETCSKEKKDLVIKAMEKEEGMDSEEKLRVGLAREKHAIFSEIYEKLNKYRPITDQLKLVEPEFYDFTIEAELSIPPGADDNEIIKVAEGKTLEFLEENKRLGRKIPKSALYAALHAPSVLEVTLKKPEFEITPKDNYGVPRCLGLTLTKRRA